MMIPLTVFLPLSNTIHMVEYYDEVSVLGISRIRNREQGTPSLPEGAP